MGKAVKLILFVGICVVAGVAGHFIAEAAVGAFFNGG